MEGDKWGLEVGGGEEGGRKKTPLHKSDRWRRRRRRRHHQRWWRSALVFYSFGGWWGRCLGWARWLEKVRRGQHAGAIESSWWLFWRWWCIWSTVPSLAKGLAFFGISGFRRKNQKMISSNGENAPPFQSENYDVFDIDEMLIISWLCWNQLIRSFF